MAHHPAAMLREPRSSRVVGAHPMAILPALAVTIALGTATERSAGRLSLIVAAGTALSIEFTARVLIRQAWQAGFWPPSEGDPVALLPVLVAVAWTSGWVLVHPALSGSAATGVRAGVLASAGVLALQLSGWLTARSPGGRRSWRRRGPSGPHHAGGGSTLSARSMHPPGETRD